MALLMMFQAEESGQVIGETFANEGALTVRAILAKEQFSDVDFTRVDPDAEWWSWEGRAVVGYYSNTESSPSGVRWQRWYLEYNLALALFGFF